MRIADRTLRLALLLAGIVSTAAAQQSPLTGLDDYVSAALGSFENPGLAVAIVSHDSVVYAKGFGVRRLGESTPVDAHTIFAIGSSSKAFTGLGVAMIVDQGKMAWDAPLTTYLPDFRLSDPWVTREFTLRDALTHRSGLARTDLVWISGQFDSRELLRRLRFVKPSSSFRTQFGYQNLMYLAAGTALVEASGASSWGDFVERRIFARRQGRRQAAPGRAGLRRDPSSAVPDPGECAGRQPASALRCLRDRVVPRGLPGSIRRSPRREHRWDDGLGRPDA